MILESAQLLCTAHRIIDGVEYQGSTATGRKARRWKLDDEREFSFYSATHINHPSAVWCRQAVENYLWLADHLFGLISEYNYRYGKTHKVAQDGLAYKLQSPPYKLENWEFTKPPAAMDKQYIVSDNITTKKVRYICTSGQREVHHLGSTYQFESDFVLPRTLGI
jgi:hypothetical protein